MCTHPNAKVIFLLIELFLISYSLYLHFTPSSKSNKLIFWTLRIKSHSSSVSDANTYLSKSYYKTIDYRTSFGSWIEISWIRKSKMGKKITMEDICYELWTCHLSLRVKSGLSCVWEIGSGNAVWKLGNLGVFLYD